MQNKTKRIDVEGQAWQVSHCAWDWSARLHDEGLESWHDGVTRRTTDASFRLVRPVKRREIHLAATGYRILRAGMPIRLKVTEGFTAWEADEGGMGWPDLTVRLVRSGRGSSGPSNETSPSSPTR